MQVGELRERGRLFRHSVASAVQGKPSWNTTGEPFVAKEILLEGLNQSLGEVSSLAFDAADHLYIVDKSKHRVLKRNRLSQLVLVVGHLNGSEGSDSLSLHSPNDIVLHGPSNLYVADTLNDRIQSYQNGSREGVTLLGTGSWSLNQPMSLALDNQSSLLFIADYGNHRIVRLNLKTNEWIVLFDRSSRADRSSYLRYPIAIEYDWRNETLLIAQELSFNIVRCRAPFSRWTLVAGSAGSDLNGTSRTLFNQLCSFSLDSSRNIHVADCFNERIQYFDNDLAKGRTVAGVVQANGNTDYLFKHPTSIAFDSKDNLHVSDSLNYRIQVFRKI